MAASARRAAQQFSTSLSASSTEWRALCAGASTCVGSHAGAWPGLAGQVDWHNFLQLAERHAVVPLVIAAAQRLPDGLFPKDIRATLAERARTQALSTLRMSAALLRISESFAAAGIGMLAVKGPALAAQAYGDAGMRTYGDLDLLVRHADMARATQLLLDAGFTAQIPLTAIAAGKIPGQYTFRRSDAGLLVELHNDKTMRYYPRTLPMDAWFARQTRVHVDGRDIPAPSLEDHLILVCVHGAKHFWERLLWIADVAALAGARADQRSPGLGERQGQRPGQRQEELRWELVAQSAKEVGAETMLNGGLLLAARLLHASLPEPVLARAEADAAARAMIHAVQRWLPEAGDPAPGLLARALFRAYMRGGVVSGAGYFLRLLFSPTEEDWEAEGGAPQSFADVLKRPFRLAKKHRGGGQR